MINQKNILKVFIEKLSKTIAEGGPMIYENIKKYNISTINYCRNI